MSVRLPSISNLPVSGLDSSLVALDSVKKFNAFFQRISDFFWKGWTVVRAFVRIVIPIAQCPPPVMCEHIGQIGLFKRKVQGCNTDEQRLELEQVFQRLSVEVKDVFVETTYTKLQQFILERNSQKAAKMKSRMLTECDCILFVHTKLLVVSGYLAKLNGMSSSQVQTPLAAMQTFETRSPRLVQAANEPDAILYARMEPVQKERAQAIEIMRNLLKDNCVILGNPASLQSRYECAVMRDDVPMSTPVYHDERHAKIDAQNMLRVATNGRGERSCPICRASVTTENLTVDLRLQREIAQQLATGLVTMTDEEIIESLKALPRKLPRMPLNAEQLKVQIVNMLIALPDGIYERVKDLYLNHVEPTLSV